MIEWKGKLTKAQAIKLLERITDHDDPYWSNIVEDYYDEETDTMPTIYHLYMALGITKEECQNATGGDIINWPEDQDSQPIATTNDFESWLRITCWQAPPDYCTDLAKDAWNHQQKRIAKIENQLLEALKHPRYKELFCAVYDCHKELIGTFDITPTEGE